MLKGMGIALQLYSVREDMEKDLPGTLRAVKAMGYEGVEFAGLYGYEPAALRALLEEIGLTAVSAHVPLEEWLVDSAACAAAYKTVGCRFAAIPWLNEDKRPGTPGFEDVKAVIPRIAAVCAAQDMPLLYHNHDFEFVKLEGEYALDRLYREFPTLSSELDTCWVKVSGEDPVAYIRRYSGRAPVVHLKDYAGEGDTFEYRPLGRGVQNIPAIIDASKDAGTLWLVAEQDSPSLGLSPLDCAKASREYLNTLF